MSIYQRFCEEAVDENGALQHISLHYPDNCNFAYDVVDAIAAETPGKRAMFCELNHLMISLYTFIEGSKIFTAVC